MNKGWLRPRSSVAISQAADAATEVWRFGRATVDDSLAAVAQAGAEALGGLLHESPAGGCVVARRAMRRGDPRRPSLAASWPDGPPSLAASLP